MWRRRICQHPIVKCAFRESERAREARRPFCSRSQGPVAALRRSSRLLQRRPANPFLRSAFDPFFCFRGAELSASSVFLPSSRCNTAHRVRRHVKSWFGATPCRRATKLPSCPCPVSSGAISISHAMISMPRPAVTVLLGAGGNRISRRLRFTEERPRSTPRGRALRRLQDQVTDSRLERALAHSCIRHIV